MINVILMSVDCLQHLLTKWYYDKMLMELNMIVTPIYICIYIYMLMQLVVALFVIDEIDGILIFMPLIIVISSLYNRNVIDGN